MPDTAHAGTWIITIPRRDGTWSAVAILVTGLLNEAETMARDLTTSTGMPHHVHELGDRAPAATTTCEPDRRASIGTCGTCGASLTPRRRPLPRKRRKAGGATP